MKKKIILGLSGLLSSTAGLADMFHYNNVIIGERAQGLGGAYTAIADDASGVYYNPAGLAFAQSNDISGSANAIYDKKVKYKDVFEGQDFTEKSNGTFSPFFGAMQKLDRYLKGLVGGFAYYTLDTELTDQNDVITNAKASSVITHNSLRRTLNRRSSTTGASIGLGYRIASNFSVGMSLTYLNSEDLIQSYLTTNSTITTSTGPVNYITSANAREKLTTYGLEPNIGVQWAPVTKLALGASVRKGQYASQKFDSQRENITNKVVLVNGASTYSETTAISTSPKSSNPVGSPPMQVRLGAAYFASTDLLIAFDVQYTGAVTDMESTYKERFKRDAVTNYSLGTEYYLSPSLPLRLGLFTNRDAVKTPTANQSESINYIGLSTFFGWAQPNSQVSLGAVFQKGTGTGMKAEVGQTQSVEALAYSIGFSATHSF